MSVVFRQMTISDFSEVHKLWLNTEGMGLDPELDSHDAIESYLEKNCGLSFVACFPSGEIVGTVLCGTDGRRGYLMHLAVAKNNRKQGIGRRLVDCSVKALKTNGITRVHVFVFKDNNAGADFWRGLGWQGRDDIMMLSLEESCGADCGRACC